MIVKFKKLHPDAVIPKAALPGDAGLDLTVVSYHKHLQFIEYKFGVSVEIPEGFVGLLVPRSNVTKMNLMLKNGVGIIDSGYRGELVARFQTVKFDDYDSSDGMMVYYNKGDRAAQLVIIPYLQAIPQEVEELSETERGIAGFGSTGIKSSL